jgi:streptomycin 6-kinase
VYYDLLIDPLPRLTLAAAVGGVPLEELLPSCLMLCVDGLLYYREGGDRRAARMADVMTALLTGTREGASC